MLRASLAFDTRDPSENYDLELSNDTFRALGAGEAELIKEKAQVQENVLKMPYFKVLYDLYVCWGAGGRKQGVKRRQANNKEFPPNATY